MVSVYDCGQQPNTLTRMHATAVSHWACMRSSWNADNTSMSILSGCLQVEAPPISDGDYLTAWNMLVLPVAEEFRPDIILVSAGFDAADKDPLGELC